MPRGEAVGRVHRDRADAVVAEVLLHLRDQRRPCRRLRRTWISSARVDLGQSVREDGVDHDAANLDYDLADVALRPCVPDQTATGGVAARFVGLLRSVI